MWELFPEVPKDEEAGVVRGRHLAGIPLLEVPEVFRSDGKQIVDTTVDAVGDGVLPARAKGRRVKRRHHEQGEAGSETCDDHGSGSTPEMTSWRPRGRLLF